MSCAPFFYCLFFLTFLTFLLIRDVSAAGATVNIPFTALRYFKTFEKALIMDMNG